MKYAYYYRSESYDEYLVGSDNNYDCVVNFLKRELPDEYEALNYVDAGYWVKISDNKRFSWI